MRFVLLCFLTLFMSAQGQAQRSCTSEIYRGQVIAADPIVGQRIVAQEYFLRQRTAGQGPRLGAAGVITALPLIRIPVVVHVVHNSVADNLSDAQIQSQIRVLNEDFRKKNADISRVPEKFSNLATDCLIEFYLATRDPQGRATTGIVRKKTNIQFFGLDDRIKKSAIGGDDAWDPSSYLNIWTGNLAGGILGYSSPIGGPAATDGVVIRSSAFGTTGTVKSPFNKGRTATHEIGHWLGVQHIWGDRYCGDDEVDDTPAQQGATQGCPSGDITSCNNQGSMYMNYMDLTNDECMQLFTAGQRQRMRALFQEGGARFNLLSSQGLSTPSMVEPVAEEGIIPVDIKLFPNPAASRLTIIDVTGNGFQNKMFRIINQFGQTVQQFRFTGAQAEVNIASLPAGLYLLDTGDRNYTRRFVKKLKG